jgi:serine kinase of HPr protein (carbohydrate metabolism regulator)
VVARWGRGGWRAALIRGPSGAGKSDLAIRAIAAGWRLVADDRAVVWASGGRLFARAPSALAGLIEARSLGVVPAPALAMAEVGLLVDLAVEPAALERIPEPAWEILHGVSVRRIDLFGAEISAPAKMAFALQRW